MSDTTRLNWPGTGPAKMISSLYDLNNSALGQRAWSLPESLLLRMVITGGSGGADLLNQPILVGSGFPTSAPLSRPFGLARRANAGSLSRREARSFQRGVRCECWRRRALRPRRLA